MYVGAGLPEPPFLAGAGAVFLPDFGYYSFSYSTENILFLLDPKYDYDCEDYDFDDDDDDDDDDVMMCRSPLEREGSCVSPSVRWLCITVAVFLTKYFLVSLASSPED